MTELTEQPKRKPRKTAKVPESPAQMAERIEAVTSPVAFTPESLPDPVAPVLEALPEPAAVEEFVEAAVSPAIVSDALEAAVEAAPIEEVKAMATTIEIPSVEKAQAMFGDVSERIKTAFEKSTKASEELVELAKGNVEAVVASARLAAKGGEQMGQEAAEYGKKSFESTMALFKSFTQVRTPTEFFQLQSDYAKASLESAVAEASKVSESLLKLAGEVVQPLSNRYAVASEKLKTVTL